ncbi:predicted protein [Nematostella vectensis]|uniref:Uncharacterized protein n=1 Tax=Nematostella vectensis TaxID=45351 RepID=A7RG29_NEMVE|nr:predicted protein [Nematostella vectensis]|eukprot:XP_001641523.1 predicted protein [Nematostella vectensis]
MSFVGGSGQEYFDLYGNEFDKIVDALEEQNKLKTTTTTSSTKSQTALNALTAADPPTKYALESTSTTSIGTEQSHLNIPSTSSTLPTQQPIPTDPEVTPARPRLNNTANPLHTSNVSAVENTTSLSKATTTGRTEDDDIRYNSNQLSKLPIGAIDGPSMVEKNSTTRTPSKETESGYTNVIMNSSAIRLPYDDHQSNDSYANSISPPLLPGPAHTLANRSVMALRSYNSKGFEMTQSTRVALYVLTMVLLVILLVLLGVLWKIKQREKLRDDLEMSNLDASLSSTFIQDVTRKESYVDMSFDIWNTTIGKGKAMLMRLCDFQLSRLFVFRTVRMDSVAIPSYEPRPRLMGNVVAAPAPLPANLSITSPRGSKKTLWRRQLEKNKFKRSFSSGFIDVQLQDEEDSDRGAKETCSNPSLIFDNEPLHTKQRNEFIRRHALLLSDEEDVISTLKKSRKKRPWKKKR